MNRNFKQRIQSQDKSNVMGIDEYVKQLGMEEGWAEGEEKKSRLFVENMLSSTDFLIEKIASLAAVSADFVNKVKGALTAG